MSLLRDITASIFLAGAACFLLALVVGTLFVGVALVIGLDVTTWTIDPRLGQIFAGVVVLWIGDLFLFAITMMFTD